MATLSEKLPEVFGREQAARKPLDYYKKTDPGRAEEQIEKSKQFAIQMLLAGAKNIDPFAEDSSSNQANQMLETANLIAQLDASTAQVSKMSEMVDAIKNPGYDAFELQGKEVSYDNGKKFFDGGSSVTFEYNLKNSLDTSKESSISTNIKIKDSEGDVVYETRGASVFGNHKFAWDGLDKNGKILPAGTYSIEVNSTVSKLINGHVTTSIIKATTLDSSIVSSIEIEGGVVKRLVLENGITIGKNQVLSVNKPESNKFSKLSADLIGKNVEIDFSKTKILDGNMEIYFNNHIENCSIGTVDIYDENKKLVKSLETNDIKPGIGKISFANLEIDNGNYVAKISVKNLDDNNKFEMLDPLFKTKILGINYDNRTIITLDDHEFSTKNINKILTEYVSDIDRRAAQYPGCNVKFNDSVFKFQQEGFNREVIAKAPLEDGAIIAHELLRIYTKENELVATLTANYTPIEQLDDASKATVTTDILGGGRYADLPPDQKLATNRHIEENVANGTYRFKDDYAAVFASGGRKLKFPIWDGTFGDIAPQNLRGGRANVNQEFITEHSTVYVKTNGETFNSESRADVNIGLVESVDKEAGELFLNLQNGQTIPESRVIGIMD